MAKYTKDPEQNNFILMYKISHIILCNNRKNN